MTMRKTAIAVCLLLGGCASLMDKLQAVDAAIVAGERDLAVLCAQLPMAAMATETAACVARANGTTQDVIARSIAVAQAICAGTVRPPSVTSALAQIEDAAYAAANAKAAGCQ